MMSNFGLKFDSTFDGRSNNAKDNVFTVTPKPFSDDRGFFREMWKGDELPGIFSGLDWVRQINTSVSTGGVFRGMHAQRGAAHAQGKLVTCTHGSIIDLILDMRPDSRSFRTLKAYHLSGENGTMLWVPRGFLHGFLSLTVGATIQYMCDNAYNKDSECGANIESVLGDDSVKRIMEPMVEVMLQPPFSQSDKDSRLPSLKKFERDVCGIDRI